MEVRFTIKGNEEETVFSPIIGREGMVKLFAESIQGKIFIPLSFKDGSHILKLDDYDIFEESREVIDERLLGLSEEWMETLEKWI